MPDPKPHLGFTLPLELIDSLADRLVHVVVEQVTEQLAMKPIPSHWLTFDQACAYLGFSRDTLYKLTAARAIPVRKKQSGQGLRFRRDELDAWMETQYPRLDPAA